MGRYTVHCLVVGTAVLLASCHHVGGLEEIDAGNSDADTDTDTDTDVDTDTDTGVPIQLDSLALLMVVDNSISMGEEQQILSQAAPALVDALQSAGVDDIRVAVVTSDMGLSWGGNPYEDGDGWPGSAPCSSTGDNGIFRTCEGMEEGWVSHSPASPNPEMSQQISCLSGQGTVGCGFEQQLQSAATGLYKDDQQEFLREGDLLMVLVISDEDDCSMLNGPGIFGSDEVQQTGDYPSELNLACGDNPEHLYTPQYFVDRFRALKGGSSNGVIFAAIAGVPPGDTCEGTGGEIGSCLDHPEMQLNPQLEINPAGQDMFVFSPACTRNEGDNVVTEATPGRRYVELAQAMPEWSYVSSICNHDWSGIFIDLADMIDDAITTY